MSVLRNVLTYMGLGPDEEYEDGYLYGASDDEADDTASDRDRVTTGDKRPDHAQRARPDWLVSSSRHDDRNDDGGGRRGTGRGSGRSDGRRVADTRSRPAAEAASGGGRPEAESGTAEPESDNATPARPRGDLATASVRPLRAVPPAGLADDASTATSTIDLTDSSSGSHRRDGGTNGERGRAMSPRQVKPRALVPQSFADAKTLADAFKNDVPVIMDLQGVDRELARRLIDFASGICYALEGGMEKIASQVFLLTPASVVVSEQDRERLTPRPRQR